MGGTQASLLAYFAPIAFVRPDPDAFMRVRIYSNDAIR